MSTPMDPERLAELREHATSGDAMTPHSQAMLQDALAEGERLRSELVTADSLALRRLGVLDSLRSERDAQLNQVKDVMRRLVTIKRKDASECNARTDERSYFCDGGASRLTAAVEMLRVALELPCEWDDGEAS